MKLAFPLMFAIGWLLAALAAAAAANAFAIGATPDACSPAAPIPKAYVGAGGDCDYHDIQSAIDAAGACGLAINITPESAWTNQTIEVHGNKKISLIGWGSGETCNHLKYCTTIGCTFNQNPPLPVTPASGHSGLYVNGDGNTITLDNLEFSGGSLGSDHGGAGIAFTGSGSLTLQDTTVDHNTAGYGGGILFSGSGSLTLQGAIVSDNTASSGNGGGILFTGTGTLVTGLDANTGKFTDIVRNTAPQGGGLYVNPSDYTAVTLGEGTFVQINTASSGNAGGIGIDGYTYLLAAAPSVLIYDNSAPNGQGGGLWLSGISHADIGSSGYIGVQPVIYDNAAAYGGGIAMYRTVAGSSRPLVKLFATDANHPASVSGNFASHVGGGIYMGGAGNNGSGYLCASDFQIDDNAAQEGSAIYDDETHDGFGDYASGLVYLNSDDGYGTCAAPPGAVPCAAGVACNEVADNVTRTSGGAATSGAAILIQSAGTFVAQRFAVRANEGGEALRFLTDEGYSTTQMHDCLIADNTASGYLIEAAPGGSTGNTVLIDNCTIAGNAIGAGDVTVAHLGSDASSSFTLTNSIVDQPGLATVDYQGPSGGLHNPWVLSNDITTLTGSGIVMRGEPDFVDAAHGDYHLLRTSKGVDYAPAGTTSADLDGRTRVVDLPDVPDAHGPMDLGAYEIQLACSVADTIFCNGFDD